MESYFNNNYGGYINNYSIGDKRKRINSNILSNPQNYQNNNLNYSNMNPNINLHNQIKKNISEITKLNYNNQNQNLNNLNQTNESQIIKLENKLIESTTEDNEHPLRELLKGLKGVGWFSSRFSQFPQEIYIQFSQPPKKYIFNFLNLFYYDK